jgi:hypothetical protein
MSEILDKTLDDVSFKFKIRLLDVEWSQIKITLNNLKYKNQQYKLRELS